MPFCNSCGKKVSADNEFCPGCGKKLTTKDPIGAETKPITKEQKPKIKPKNWMLYLGIVIILGFVIFTGFQTNKQKQLDLENRLNQIEAEKLFCNSLQLQIKKQTSILGQAVPDYFCITLNQGDTIKLKVTFKNGGVLEEEHWVFQGTCLQHIGYETVEVQSKRCPSVKAMLLNS